MNVKSKPIVQVLKGSSWKSKPGLGVRIAPKRTTALLDIGDGSAVLGYFQ